MSDEQDNMCEFLEANGWREYPNQLRECARCFFKRFPTPTRCACNHDKDGIQICISVYEWKHRSTLSYEIELNGELPDGPWINLHNYSMPKDIREGIATIPRLLATWEFIANQPKQ